MALRLTINGIDADLGKNQGITLKQKSDFFNLELIEPTVSFPFDLPDTPNNRRIFSHVNIPSSTQPMAKELPAILEADGALVRNGVFVLDRYRQNFEGYFKADAGVFSSIKDSLISEYVDDVIELEGQEDVEILEITDELINSFGFDTEDLSPFDLQYVVLGLDDPAPYFAQLFDGRYDALESAIVFPAIYREADSERHLKGFRLTYGNRADFETRFKYFGGFPAEYEDNWSVFTDFIPAVKLRYIIEKIANSQGYEVEFNIADYYINQAVLFCERGMYNFPARVGDFLPILKVSEFLNSCKKLGMVFAFNSKEQRLVVSSVRSVMGSDEYVDFTPFVSPDVEIEAIVGDTGNYEWGFENDEARTGERLTDSIAIDSVASENIGKIQLIKHLNTYIKAESFTPQPDNTQSPGYEGITSFWRSGFLVDAEKGSALEDASESKFVPLPNVKDIIRQESGVVVENVEYIPLGRQVMYLLLSSNIINRIKEFDDAGLDGWSAFRIRILNVVEYGDAFHQPIQETSGPFALIENLTYLGARNDLEVEIYFRFPNPAFPPSSPNGQEYIEMPFVRNGLENSPCISMWHGVVKGYQYANSGNYSQYLDAVAGHDGVKLSDVALRWEGDDGLFEQVFKNFDESAELKKLFTLRGYLPLTKALNFQPLTKIMSQHVKYLVTNLEAVYRNDRRNERVRVEVECRRV